MLHGLLCQLVLVSCWIAGFLLTSASRAESEDDSSSLEPQDAEHRVLTVQRPATFLEEDNHDVLLAAHDSLLQVREGSLIQQHSGFDSLLATRDALLNAMKDKQTVSSDARGSVPQGSTSASLNLPYSSFVSPAPSETTPGTAGQISPESATTPTAQSTTPNTIPPPTVPIVAKPSVASLQQDLPGVGAISHQAKIETDAASHQTEIETDAARIAATSDSGETAPIVQAELAQDPQVNAEKQTPTEAPTQPVVVQAELAQDTQANGEKETPTEAPTQSNQNQMLEATTVKVTNLSPTPAPTQSNEVVAAIMNQLENTKAEISKLSQALTDANAQRTGDQAANKANAGQWVGKDFSGYFKSVKYTVIRIQAITAEVNWFQPYQQPQDTAMVGSGLAVFTDDDCHKDPVFLTNAHVVRDAHDVQVQIPALGQVFFDAYVPLICEDFDLAVVQLANPAEFLEALKGKTDDIDGTAIDNAKVHGNVQALVIEDWPLILGLEVASVGFPLGSTSIKLSRGVISGTEEVGDFICYQTTAPISPGSSGGPLFALNEANKLQVIGATFASAASREAQNTNYVVPTVSIIQVINEFLRLKKLRKAQAANASQGTGSATQDNNSEPCGDGSDIAAPVEVQANSAQTDKISSGSPSDMQPETANITSSTQGTDVGVPADNSISQSPSTVGNDASPPTDQGSSQSGQDPTAVSESTTRAGVGGLAITSVAGEKLKLTSNKIYDKMKKVKMHGHVHNQFRIAPVDSVGIEANKALYEMEGCNSGVFLSKILSTSVFKHSDLGEIQERCFLTKVADTELDSFGMGRTKSFLGDPTPFESLMMEKAKDGELVPVTICKGGKTQEYKVNMKWNPDWYEMGVKDILEPHFETEAMDYEVFAGVTIMQMSVQHVIKLLRGGEPPTIGRWLLPENQKQQHVIVTHVEKGTYASRVLAPGMVVDKVNGKTVTTLKELRDIFMPPDNKPYWELVTDRNVIFATSFLEALENQIAMAESGFNYLWTDMIVTAAESSIKHLQSKGYMLKQPSDRAGGAGVVSATTQTQVPVTRENFLLGSSGESLHDTNGGNAGQSSSRTMVFPDAEGRLTKLTKARALMITAGANHTDHAVDVGRSHLMWRRVTEHV